MFRQIVLMLLFVLTAYAADFRAELTGAMPSPYNFTGGPVETLTISVDRGLDQVFIFNDVDFLNPALGTVEEVIAVLNGFTGLTPLSGATATNSGGFLKIQSNSTGKTSSIKIKPSPIPTANAVLGFSDNQESAVVVSLDTNAVYLGNDLTHITVSDGDFATWGVNGDDPDPDGNGWHPAVPIERNTKVRILTTPVGSFKLSRKVRIQVSVDGYNIEPDAIPAEFYTELQIYRDNEDGDEDALRLIRLPLTHNSLTNEKIPFSYTFNFFDGPLLGYHAYSIFLVSSADAGAFPQLYYSSVSISVNEML